MRDTKKIVAEAVKNGATLTENVVIQGVSFSLADQDNVDFWVTLTVDAELDRLREREDGKEEVVKSKSVVIHNGIFLNLLRSTLNDSDDYCDLGEYIKIINSDMTKAAISAHTDTPFVPEIVTLLKRAKINLVSRKVKANTEVDSLFALNKTTHKVKRNSIWYDGFDLRLTRAEGRYWEDDDSETTVYRHVLKHYRRRNKENEAALDAAKANGVIGGRSSVRAAATSSVAQNLPD